MTEKGLMHDIMLALSDAGHTVFRANVGLMYTKDGRPIRTGLPVGFSDLFGFTKDGRPFFFEVKTETGTVSKSQRQFIDQMHCKGAIAAVVRTVDCALFLCDHPEYNR